jgi:type IV secretion system protein TrbB
VNAGIEKADIRVAEPAMAKIARTKLERECGGLLLDVLHDPKVIEVMCNPDGTLWMERLGEGMRRVGALRRAQAQAVIETVAGALGKEVTARSPLLEGEWPLDGSRFAGQLPPVVSGPTFAIRKRASAIFRLSEYVAAGIMSEPQRMTIGAAVREHLNVLVIGGTGSGKTTLVNAIIAEMVEAAPSERIVVIEDTGEIQCAAENAVLFHTTPDVSMTDLVRATLRMRPDRILVGEMRGPEALDLLDAWNTGHGGGAATLHANSAADALDRLASLVTRNASAPADIERLIGQAVQVVVHIARDEGHGGRRVAEVLRVHGFEGGKYLTNHA